MEVVFACKHWGSITLLQSGEKCCCHRNIFLLLHTWDFWQNCHGWEVGKCQELDVLLSLGCCSGQIPHVGCWKQEELDTDPPRAASEAGMPGEGSPGMPGEGSPIPPALAQLPASTFWGDPGLQVPGSHLHSLFFLSAIFLLKTTCGNKLVQEGRVLSLLSFWLEIYFSVHVLCSCTWQSGVCSAVHSPANLVS